jgi:hypothetical protein
MSKNESSILDENYNTFNYFFGSLIGACSFIIVLPKMSSNPNILLFCYFFMALSVIALFLNWYFKKIGSTENGTTEYSKEHNKMVYYVLPSVLFIIVSIFSSFIMISNHKIRIQNGYVTDYYYKFIMISIWLMLIECYLLWNLYDMINKGGNLQLYMIIIICFCTLNYFIILSNWIGLSYFSVDG